MPQDTQKARGGGEKTLLSLLGESQHHLGGEGREGKSFGEEPLTGGMVLRGLELRTLRIDWGVRGHEEWGNYEGVLKSRQGV
jgi:hypothetical protein